MSYCAVVCTEERWAAMKLNPMSLQKLMQLERLPDQLVYVRDFTPWPEACPGWVPGRIIGARAEGHGWLVRLDGVIIGARHVRRHEKDIRTPEEHAAMLLAR